MNKSKRRILALALSLALVCATATAAFATYCTGDFVTKPFDTITLTAGIDFAEYSAEAYVKIGADNSEALRTATIEADVGLEYTYCPESAMRPSNYMTATKHGILYKMNNSTTDRLVLSTGNLTYSTYGDCVVLEATGNFVIDYTTPNSSGEYAPDPLHVVNESI